MNHDERRKRTERRLIDLGPPNGMEERRLNPDRRKPQIEEQVLSEEEWARYFSPKQFGTESSLAFRPSSE